MNVLEKISATMADQSLASQAMLAHIESADPSIFANPDVVREAILHLMRLNVVTANSLSVLADAMRQHGLEVTVSS